jgi:oxygen-dependent protoporphyrinogen oxidase
MVQALLASLGPETIRLGAGVRRVGKSSEPASYAVEVDGALLEARSVIFATPAYVTADLAGALDSDLARVCAEIRYVSTATIVLGFRRTDVRHPLTGSGFVVPRVERSGILAASWMSSKWPHRAPDDRVLLRTFVGGARDPDALENSDAVLIERSLAALTPLLGIGAPPLLERVYRWVRSGAQHEIGHLERVAAVERALARLPGVFVTGSGFRGVGIPDCIADGRATARQAARWLAGHTDTSSEPQCSE